MPPSSFAWEIRHVKALAYYRHQLVGKNAVLFDSTTLFTNGIAFETKDVFQLGVVGPESLAREFFEKLKRHRRLDAALLLRIATYEVEETRWSALFTTDVSSGVFYLFRQPGHPASLQFLPFRDKAIVVTQRAVRPHYLDAMGAHAGLEAYTDQHNKRQNKAA
jgi:hypothetical protein